MNRTKLHALWIPTTLIVLALGVRILVLTGYERGFPYLDVPVLDAEMYHEDASRVARGEALSDGPFYHAPGYPLFLSGLYRLFGASPWTGVTANLLLGLGSVWLTLRLGTQRFDAGTGYAGALLLILYGPLVFFETKLLIAPLAVFLSLLAAWAVAGAETSQASKPVPWRALLAGVVAGALGIVRANLLLVAAMVALVWMVSAIRGQRSWAVPIAFVLGASLFILPTTVHNLRHGALAPVAVQGGFNFYAGNHPEATGVYEGVPGVQGGIRTQEADADAVVLAETGRVLPPDEESRYWLARARSEITQNPARWLRLLATKTRLLMSGQEEAVNGSWGLERERVSFYRVLFLPFNLLVALGLAGGFAAVRARRPGLLGAYALLVAVLATAILFFVMSRIRLPAVGILAVFGGHAVALAVREARAGRVSRVLAGVVFVTAFTALTWTSPLGASRTARWDAQYLLALGRGAASAGDPARALDAYRDAARLDPVLLPARLAAVELLMRSGDLPGATFELEAAAVIEPNNPTLHNNLGLLYYTAERWDDADRALARTLELDPGLAAPYLYRGRLAKRDGDPRAADLFEAAIERDPRLGDAYVERILIALNGQDPTTARAWAARARSAGVALPPAVIGRLDTAP